MKVKRVKSLLFSEIKKVSDNISSCCFHPEKDFTRNRKLSSETILKGIIGMESGSLANELIDFFHSSPEMPSVSAFVQQRSKIKPEAFKAIFEGFSSKLRTDRLNEMPILAVDGTDIQIPTDSEEKDSYYPGSDGQKGYNLLHLNELYDLKHQTYINAIIQQKTDKMNTNLYKIWLTSLLFSRFEIYNRNVKFPFKKGDVYPARNLCTFDYV